MNIREELAAMVADMTGEQFELFMALMRFGFKRVKAGESAETVTAEYLAQQKEATPV